MCQFCKWLTLVDMGYGPYEEHFEYCNYYLEKSPICTDCPDREPEEYEEDYEEYE